MALTKEDILEGISALSGIELKELLDAFEEKFGVRCHPHRRWSTEDPGHQGCARAHQPRSEGSQGPRRRRTKARARKGQQGRRRQGQGQARRGWRQRRSEVSRTNSDSTRPGQPGRDRNSSPGASASGLFFAQIPQIWGFGCLTEPFLVFIVLPQAGPPGGAGSISQSPCRRGSAHDSVESCCATPFWTFFLYFHLSACHCIHVRQST